MTDSDFDFITRLLRKARRKQLNIIEIHAAIRLFKKLNPTADPSAIDWVGVWDPTLTYSENLEALRRNYPMFRWRDDEMLELDEEAVEHLVRLGQEMADAEEEKEKVEEVAPAQAEITLSLLARYPVLPEARDLAAAFELGELMQNRLLLSKAEERVVEAIQRGDRGTLPRDDPLEDLLTHGLGSFIVAAVGDPWLRRRWALAEARRVERFLHRDPDHVLLHVAGVLGIRAARCDLNEEEKTGYPYKIGLADYLRLCKGLDGAEWRLVNRTVWRGFVYVARAELVRLAAEEVEARILRRLEEVKLARVPEEVREVVERIRGMLATRFARAAPTAEVSRDEATWPPCMLALKNALLSGSKVGHFGNFAFAAFLLTLGYSVEEVVGYYANRPDFDEKIARYQVEHIAGMRGSRIKYRPPSCRTMRTHGLCVEEGRLCPRTIRNPAEFRSLKREGQKQPTQT